MPDDSKKKKRWRRIVLILAAIPILAAVGLFAASWIVQWSIDAMVVLKGKAQRVAVQIDRDSTIAREARWKMSRVHAALRDAGVDVEAMEVEGPTIRMFGVPEPRREAARAILASQLPGWSIDDGSDPWQVTLPASQEERTVRSAVEQTVDVFSDRLKALGARAIRVRERSVESLRFEITFTMLGSEPSVTDNPTFVNTAVLELREVAARSGLGASDAGLRASLGIEFCRPFVGDIGRTLSAATIAAPIVAGGDFDSCYRSTDTWGDPLLLCALSEGAGRRLRAFTSENRGREIALVEWEESGCRLFFATPIAEPFGEYIVFSGLGDERTVDDVALRAKIGRIPARVSVSD